MAVTTKGRWRGVTQALGGIRRRMRGRLRWPAAAILVLAVAATAGSLGYDRYRASRLADSARRAFAERRYEAAREPLRLWLDRRPRSAEAHYYRAWLALADDRPPEAAEATRRRRSWASTGPRSRFCRASIRPVADASATPSPCCAGRTPRIGSRAPRSPASWPAST